MAEALAVIGVVASIVQLVDFGTKICLRLNEFRDKVGDIPDCYRQIHTQLPLLLDVLDNTQQDIGAGVIGSNTEKALLPVVLGCREQIENLHTIIDKTLPSLGDSWAKRGRKALSSLKQDPKVEKITSTLESYVQTLTYYHAAARSTPDPLKENKLAKIRNWLSAPDPSANYEKGLKLRQVNTGLWFLEDERYAKWKTSPSSYIWLNGIPGCGKSVLSSTIIEDVLGYCEDDPGKATAYFFFDFKESQKQSQEAMIKSLVTQLSQQCVKIPAGLNSPFDTCAQGQRQPSMETLLSAMRQMIEEVPATYITIDALDECTDREELLETIDTIAAWHLESLHIVVTSRSEPDITDTLACLVPADNIISLRSKIIDEDIVKYVCNRITTDKKLRKWRSENIRKEIEDAIMAGAHGMFRWAVCQLDSLGNCLNRKMLRQALTQLPPTLDDTYERILCGIHEDHSEHALRILTWITFSKWPLSLEEIAEVSALEPRARPAFDKDKILEDPMDALKICGSLLTVSLQDESVTDYWSESNYSDHLSIEDDPASDHGSETEDNHHSSVKDEQGHTKDRRILTLAHYSVKEYLTSSRIGQGRARFYTLRPHSCNVHLANSCLSYLLPFQEPVPSVKYTVATHKLLHYCAWFWAVYVRSFSNREEQTQNLILELLLYKKEAFQDWDHLAFQIGRLTPLEDQPALALHCASHMGLTETVQDLIHAGVDLNTLDVHNRSPLYVAVSHSFYSVVKLLLEAGADTNIQAEHGFTELYVASECGNTAVLKLLLDAGADANIQDKYGFTVLHTASLDGNAAVIKLLLDAGADINIGDRYGCTALYAVSQDGNTAMVKLLLDAGADINIQDNLGHTALYTASQHSNTVVIKLLLDAGADVNIQDNLGHAALYAALQRDNIAVIKLLLDAGADVNIQDNLGQAALQYASSLSSETIVKLLLDAGTDVNNQNDDSGASALLRASARGHTAIVKLLLDAGADVNRHGSLEHDSPIFYKAQLRKFHERASPSYLPRIDRLPQVLSDKKMQGYRYRATPLQVAADLGHENVVKLLMDAGGVMNQKLRGPHYSLHPSIYNVHSTDHESIALSTRQAGSFCDVEVNGQFQEESADHTTDRTHGEGGVMSTPRTRTFASVTSEFSVTGGDVKETRQVPHEPQRSLPSKMESVSRTMCQTLTGTRHSPTFYVHWDLPGWAGDQLEDPKDLTSALTITGEGVNAFATTCGRYLAQFWPKDPWNIIGLVERAMGANGTQSFETSCDDQVLRVSVDLNGLDPMMIATPCTIVSATGPIRRLVELAQQLSWLSAVFRTWVQEATAISLTELRWTGSQEEFGIWLLPPVPIIDRSCWHTLFPQRSVASGFPIPDRTTEKGLELPLSVMVDLSVIWNEVGYKRGMILKGYSTALLPISTSSESTQWHYVTAQSKNSKLTMDELLRLDLDIAENSSWKEVCEKRTFLGFCEHTLLNLARPGSNFESITKSGLPECGSELVLERTVGFGFQQYVTLNFKVQIAKPERARRDLSEDDLDDLVEESRGNTLLFYDIRKRRSWLVPEFEAILHLMLAWAASRRPDQGRDALLRSLPQATSHSADDLYASYVSSKGKVLKPAYGNERPRHVSDEFKYFFKELDRRKCVASNRRGRRKVPVKSPAKLAKGAFRPTLEGWDVEHIIQKRRDDCPLSIVLANSTADWEKIQQDENVLVILGNNFGELIKPTQSIDRCLHWSAHHHQNDYMVASMSCIVQQTKKSRQGELDFPMLSNDMYLTQPRTSLAFDACPFDGRTSCCRLQHIQATKPREPLPWCQQPNSAIMIGTHLLSRDRPPCTENP